MLNVNVMGEKILITIWRDQVAPRFDLTSEVLIAFLDPEGELDHTKTVVLPTVSAEDLCHMILTDDITTVVCGGIEEEYYQYLTWKRVKVIDSVIGPYEQVLGLAVSGQLETGSNLMKQASQDRDD